MRLFVTGSSEIMSSSISSDLVGSVILSNGEAKPGESAITVSDRELLLNGLACPMPLLKTKLELKRMSKGQILFVRATDSGSWRDIPTWLNRSTHELLNSRQNENGFEFWIQCGDQ